MRTFVPLTVRTSVSDMVALMTSFQAVRMGARERGINWFSINSTIEVNLLYDACTFLSKFKGNGSIGIQVKRVM